MGTPSVTLDELRGLLGDLDELALERIAATGATIDEIGEALDELESRRGYGEQPRVPRSARASEVGAILAELADDGDGDDGQTFDGVVGGHPV